MNAASFFPGIYANWQRGERSSDSFIVCRVWELHLYPSHSKPLPFPLFLLVARSLPKQFTHMSYDQHSDCHTMAWNISSVCTPYSLIHSLFVFSFSHLNKPSGDEFKREVDWFGDFTLHVKTDAIGLVSWLDWGSSEWTESFINSADLCVWIKERQIIYWYCVLVWFVYMVCDVVIKVSLWLI